MESASAREIARSAEKRLLHKRNGAVAEVYSWYRTYGRSDNSQINRKIVPEVGSLPLAIYSALNTASTLFQHIACTHSGQSNSYSIPLNTNFWHLLSLSRYCPILCCATSRNLSEGTRVLYWLSWAPPLSGCSYPTTTSSLHRVEPHC